LAAHGFSLHPETKKVESMKVMKFGGTSLGNAARMRQVAGIIRREQDVMVVCSAMAGVTDRLVTMAMSWKQGDAARCHAILSDLQLHFEKTCYELLEGQPAFSDCTEAVRTHFLKMKRVLEGSFNAWSENWLLARGELITTTIFAHYINSTGVEIHWLNAFDFMKKNEQDEPVVEDIRRRLEMLPAYNGNGRYLTQGYICRDHQGHPSNLARGGSDYSATLLGAAVNARRIEIWTDIDGMHQNDPRVVPGTRPIRELSFGEAAELAYFGAKILHPACVWPASANNIPIILKNTMEPGAQGTLIHSETVGHGIRAVAAKDGITVIRIRSARMLNAYGFLRRVFEIFEQFKTPIDVITTSEVSVSLTIDDATRLPELCNALEALGSVEVERDQSIVCVVGDVLECHKGHAATIMHAVSHLTVKMLSFGGSHNNLSLVLPSSQKADALLSLQQQLFPALISENSITR
jgi:aspartate kinase